MAGPNERVSDADREHAVAQLREHLLAGRLTLEEFSERVELAYGAQVAQELARAGQDLPDAGNLPAVRSRRKPTRVTAAFFGHVARRGRLRLRRRTFAGGAFSDVDLDLRDAQLDSPHASVNVAIAFGNVDVYVPEGINVSVGGLALFGAPARLGPRARPAGRARDPRPRHLAVRHRRRLAGARRHEGRLRRDLPPAPGAATPGVSRRHAVRP